MSDNPADSLRRELEAALARSRHDASCLCRSEEHLTEADRRFTKYDIGAIWPLVAAALEAARADERERLALALMRALSEAPIDEHMGLMAAAEIVRAVSDGN